MVNNILITGEYNRATRSIDFNEGIERKIGLDWAEKWEVNSVNVWHVDVNKNEAIVRVSLESKEDE